MEEKANGSNSEVSNDSANGGKTNDQEEAPLDNLTSKLEEPKSTDFKKPTLLIGPKKGFHKFTKVKPSTSEVKEEDKPEDDTPKIIPSKSPAESLQDQSFPLPYKEPSWACSPGRKYLLEVLKSGSIVETYELSTSFFVFGRSTAANCSLAHPSISRYHAVLQFGKLADDPIPGFYLYDLNSTHGTFFNKSKIKPHLYVRLQVGHMIKLGLSTRLFILQGPPDDEEPESELTVTEMKNIRNKEKLAQQLAKATGEVVKDDDGIDWGMGDDADEETDLSVNPYASSQNEELYLDDPKKTLRGWFEREGIELVYDCQEKGFGQYVCRVELPVDDNLGKPLVAEAVVKGKKKEAVIKCALEACRLLDQNGHLRQSNHESRKKREKDWEADDFYDSDDDVYLDRTGTVERKRQKRMQQAGAQQIIHTYPGLLAEHGRIMKEVESVQALITSMSTPAPKPAAATDDELDSFMATLSSEATIDKAKLSSLKGQLVRLKQDEHRIRTLTNIARPAIEPELANPFITEESASAANQLKSKMPIIGKRKIPAKKSPFAKVAPKQKPGLEQEEEFDSD